MCCVGGCRCVVGVGVLCVCTCMCILYACTKYLYLFSSDTPHIPTQCPSSLNLLVTWSPGPNTFQDTTNFIRDKFVSLNRHPEKKTVYTHVTCATDTDNIQFVFDSVVDIIISEHFRTATLF